MANKPHTEKTNIFNFNKVKFKIIVKGDPEEKPVIYHDKLMTFRTKFTLKEFLNKLNKDRIMEYEWVAI